MLQRRKALRAIRGLHESGTPQVVPLARALEKSVSDTQTKAEQDWFDSIEKVRDRLLLSEERVQLVDYGAGPKDDLASGTHVIRAISEVCRTASKPRRWASVLFHVIRETHPKTSVELGTCLGISGAYQAAALRLNGAGRFITLEGAEGFAKIAASNFREFGFSDVRVVVGRFADTLPNVLRAHAPIDYAFIDGHHEESATLAYFEQFVPFLSPSALLVFDDFDRSDEMKRA
jgi:hypothetical protein